MAAWYDQLVGIGGASSPEPAHGLCICERDRMPGLFGLERPDVASDIDHVRPPPDTGFLASGSRTTLAR
jgi:hypothetical protein